MIKVGVVGGTGYTGVELLRLLAGHPEVELRVITSRSEAGQAVADMFPNLRGHVDLRFSEPDPATLAACDLVFFATPNGTAMQSVPDLLKAGVRVVDLAADFRLRDAPAVARVLQAVTLYGLVEVMQGPGLGVTRLTAPFALDGSVLTLKGARAFSPSVGATTEGTVDLTRGAIDVKGTIVPAYFFNTLLGRLPIVGRLFSPEPGGGLFAASYTVTGTTKDPDVSVNPLTALTPGFLRGLFGLF